MKLNPILFSASYLLLSFLSTFHRADASCAYMVQEWIADGGDWVESEPRYNGVATSSHLSWGSVEHYAYLVEAGATLYVTLTAASPLRLYLRHEGPVDVSKKNWDKKGKWKTPTKSSELQFKNSEEETTYVYVAVENHDGWGSEEYSLFPEMILQKEPGTTTFAVYMNADNNLEYASLNDILEMSAVGSSDKVNFVVLSDRCDYGNSCTSQSILGEVWTDAQVFCVLKNQLVPRVSLGERNMGNPDILSWWVSYSTSFYPADRNIMLLWDHGGGWQGFGADGDTANTPEKSSTLTLPQLREGFSDGLRDSPIDKYDIIAFDACLMGNLDVALAVRPFGHYLIASENLVPGYGWNYDVLKVLERGQAAPIEELGKLIIDGYFDQSDHVARGVPKSMQMQVSLTMSMVDLTKIANLHLKALKQMIDDEGEEALVTVAKSRGSFVEEFAVNNYKDPTRDYALIDLERFLFDLDMNSDSANLKPAIDEAVRAFEDCVVYSRDDEFGPLGNGLTIYFPSSNVLGIYENAISGLKMEPWKSFLKNYRRKSELAHLVKFKKPQKISLWKEVAEDGGATEEYHYISADTRPGEGGKVLFTTVHSGFYVDDGASSATIMTSTIMEDNAVEGDTVTMAAGSAVLGLCQGRCRQPLMAFTSYRSIGEHRYEISIPLSYTSWWEPDPQTIWWKVSFHTESGMVSEAFWPEGGGAISQILEVPEGAKVVPSLPEDKNGVWTWGTLEGTEMGLDLYNHFSGEDPFQFRLMKPQEFKVVEGRKHGSVLELCIYNLDEAYDCVKKAVDKDEDMEGMDEEGEQEEDSEEETVAIDDSSTSENSGNDEVNQDDSTVIENSVDVDTGLEDSSESQAEDDVNIDSSTEAAVEGGSDASGDDESEDDGEGEITNPIQRCTECSAKCCRVWLGDGECDVACNVEACSFDSGDCTSNLAPSSDDSEHVSDDECAPGCPVDWIGDGVCDLECMQDSCGMDEVDCLLADDDLFRATGFNTHTGNLRASSAFDDTHIHTEARPNPLPRTLAWTSENSGNTSAPAASLFLALVLVCLIA